MKRTESILIAVACAALALVFLYLTGYALAYTSVIAEDGYLSEPIVEKTDAFWLNCLWLACGLLLAALFGRVEARIPVRLMVCLALGWVLLAGTYWVCAARTIPRADAGYIATAARRVLDGNYAEIKRPSGYFNQHPYQVGFLLLSQLLQAVFGKGNYLALQLFNVLALAGAYAAVLRLGWRMTHSARVLRYAALLLMLCVQPVLYCTFLYGNILSVACALWAANLLIAAAQCDRARLLLPAGLLCGFSVLFKPNGWLPTLALIIVGGLWLLSEKKWKLLPLLVALALGPLLVTGGVKAYYSVKTGADLEKGVPMTAYLAMGLQESSRAPGWYNEYVDRVYKATKYDPVKTSARAVKNIRMRLAQFAEDPGYAASFFHEKMVSQWNETTFEAIWISKTCKYEKTRLPLAREVLNGGLRAPLERYMEGFTILLYACFTAGLWRFVFLLLAKKRAVERAYGLGMAFIAVTVLGAFLYHMIFEAKSQYLFVYLLMMIPLAADALATAAPRSPQS